MRKQDIIDKLQKMKPQLNKDGIEKIGIFGSYAKGTFSDKSDIDIVYKTTDSFINKFKGWNAFSYLNENLRNEIAKEFNISVDIFDLSSDSSIKDKIDKEAIYV